MRECPRSERASPRRAGVALRARRAVARAAVTLPLLAIPGPCTTFDGETADARGAPDGAAIEAGADAALAAPYLTLDEALRACALLRRCVTLPPSLALSTAVAVDAASFPACVHALTLPVPPSRLGIDRQRDVLRAIARAEDCAGALEAMPVELLYGDDPRCPGGVDSTCRGDDTAVFCGASGYGALYRCAADLGGPRCVAVAMPDGGAAQGACGEGRCASNVPDAYCDGTRLKTCEPRVYKLETTFDCASVGLACGFGVDGYVSCVTPGRDERCPAFGLATCDGDTLRYCSSTGGQRWSTLACGDVGATCVGGLEADGGGSMPLCLPRARACSPRDPEVGRCDGSVIALCVAGEPTRVDCASIGKQCDATLRTCL